MQVGERGQVTIPKDARDRFDIGPETEASIVLRKAPGKFDLAARSFKELGYSSVGRFIEDIRGR